MNVLRRGWFLTSLCTAFVAGCGSEDVVNEQNFADQQEFVSQQETTLSEDSGVAPTPVASLTLENGNVVELYEFGRRAVIMESGVVYSPQMYKPQRRPRVDELVATWESLAPGEPVPQAVRDLQERLVREGAMEEPTNEQSPSADVGGTAFGESAPSPTDDNFQRGAGGDALQGADLGVQLQSPVGCNNGCCDFDWLSTISQCSGNYGYSWFMFNYLWSYANTSSVWTYDGFVCSAAGTSTYKVNVVGEGYGGTWSVPQATWRAYSWTDDTCGVFCSDEDVNSSVNTSSTPHLHTYCGGVNH